MIAFIDEHRARHSSLGGCTTETLKHPIARRIIAGVDPVDRILGLLSRLIPTALNHV